MLVIVDRVASSSSTTSTVGRWSSERGGIIRTPDNPPMSAGGPLPNSSTYPKNRDQPEKVDRKKPSRPSRKAGERRKGWAPTKSPRPQPGVEFRCPPGQHPVGRVGVNRIFPPGRQG